MPDMRPARYVDNEDETDPGTVVLKMPCQGSDTFHDGTAPCTEEKRYVITRGQLDAYIEGEPLTDIWPDPDPYLADPWCKAHNPRGPVEVSNDTDEPEEIDPPHQP